MVDEKRQGRSAAFWVYADPSKPLESEILQKQAEGYRLFEWERSILAYAKLRRGMYETQKCCAYCNVELALEDATIDHKMPRSRGGCDDPENLALACYLCNQKKRSMTVEEFAATGNGKNMPPKPPGRFDYIREKRRMNYLNFQIMFYARAPLC